ncbi:ALTERED XYLOGLUCAN 4 protein [Spatholobus suberectus]|nr:ALTERED XYLOGLUCAN 4 protein [Spatholobus suberectus]
MLFNLQKMKRFMTPRVTTSMGSGSVTREVLCTMEQPVAQSKRTRTASHMEGLTWVIFIGGGSLVSAIFQGLTLMLFSTLLTTSTWLLLGTLARKQLESLLCMLAAASSSSSSAPNLVYNNDSNKFRRWHFPSHNATVSVYWSPFLVKGVEKSNNGSDHNELYLNHVDERWGGDMGQMDLIVQSIGHWFLHPAVHYEGGLVLGCHYCPGLNHSEIGFYDALRKALRTALMA